MDADQYLFFLSSGLKNPDFRAFSPLVGLKLDVGEALEIRLDIWSPSEGTWSEAKEAPPPKKKLKMTSL